MDDLFGLNDNPIDRFINRFGTAHGHLEMAYHAALPLALTPDLLYLIWANFRSDAKGQPLNMQWVTVADLILSPLCREIRHETYVMETAVRQELLNRMAKDERFGPEYILRLGQFIQHYASQYIQSDIPSLRQFAQAQVWAAQAYTEPDRLLENLAGQYSQQPDEAETMRLADLLDTFSEPLNLDWVPTTVETTVNYDRLHTFGDGLAKFVRGDTQAATRQLRRLLGPTRELNIGSIPLPVPTAVSQALAKQEDKVYTYRVTVQDETAVYSSKIDHNNQLLGGPSGTLNLPSNESAVEIPNTRTINRAEFQKLLVENFTLEEIDAFLVELQLEETFSGPANIARQVRELISHLRRRNRLDNLLKLCVQERPNIDWSTLIENYTPPPDTEFRNLVRRVESGEASPDQIRQLGQQLFNILFDENLSVDFLTFYEQAVLDNAFVRLELSIDNSANQNLAFLPWELLCLPDATGFGIDWLAAAPEVMFFRSQLQKEPNRKTHFLSQREPIRIALVVSPFDPNDPDQLIESSEEVSNTYKALTERYQNDIEYLGHFEGLSTFSKFIELVEWPDIVHFIVRSRQLDLSESIEGEVALDDDIDGFTGSWTSRQSFVELVTSFKPSLVILQCDENAKPDMLRGLQDIMAHLSQSDKIPKALSWQFPTKNATIAKFIHTVLPALAQGVPFDEAIQNGRRALLRDDNPLAFAAPSLFSNTIVRRRTANEPVPRTLPISLGIALAGSDVTTVLEKGEVLPAKSEPLTLVSTGQTYHLGLGFIAVQLFQGEMVFGRDNLLLAEVVIDDPDVYSGEIEIEVAVSVNVDSSIQFQVTHADSSFSREITVSLRDDALIGQPRIQDVAEIINWQLQGVTENYHLATLTAVSDWLNTTDADRVFVITGERSSGKTTVASLLARYFRGDSQPPNDLYALASTSTSAVYFCQPSRPETLHPRSFILTIATQWASRDTHFAYLQPVIDNHETYELDELVRQLLIKPFTDIDELIYPGSIVFLIDDLDAALQYSDETSIVDVILQMIDAHLGVRFLLTSQMQTAVRDKLAYVASQYLPLGDRYENFDIHYGLPLPGTDIRYPLIVSSETNGELRDVEQSFSSIAELGYEKLARLRDLASNSEEVLAIGQRLFSVLMREPNYEMMRRSLNAAKIHGKEGLRVRISFDDPALQAYPWELCHDGNSFVFNNPNQPVLLQRLVSTENYQAARALSRPMRLLVAIANPADMERADVDRQEKIIREASEDVINNGEFELQVIHHTTLRTLESTVRSFQPNILQFVCYSIQEENRGLVLEDDFGRRNPVPVSAIAKILNANLVQLVVLTPIDDWKDNVTQLASKFIQQGSINVLAEQFLLPYKYSVEFMSAFLRAVHLEYMSVDESVQYARNRLSEVSNNPLFWFHSTLFCTAWHNNIDKDISETDSPMDSSNEVSQMLNDISKKEDEKEESEFLNDIHWRALVRRIHEQSFLPITNDFLPEKFHLNFLESFKKEFGYLESPGEGSFDFFQFTQYLVSTYGDRSSAVIKFLDFYKSQMIDYMREYPTNQSQYGPVLSQNYPLKNLSVSEIAKEISFPFSQNDHSNPLAILATLPIPIYITSSWFNFLEDALLFQGKKPRTMVCLWNESIVQDINSPFEKELEMFPSAERPLVFHIFGIESSPESLVITDDDLLDLTIAIQRNDVIPIDIRAGLMDNSLLIIGFDTTKLNFKTIFRGLIANKRNFRRKVSLLVQQEELGKKEPDSIAENMKSTISDFLKMNFIVYFGTPEKFTKELLERFKTSNQ